MCKTHTAGRAADNLRMQAEEDALQVQPIATKAVNGYLEDLVHISDAGIVDVFVARSRLILFLLHYYRFKNPALNIDTIEERMEPSAWICLSLAFCVAVSLYGFVHWYIGDGILLSHDLEALRRAFPPTDRLSVTWDYDASTGWRDDTVNHDSHSCVHGVYVARFD
ncbi:hypothetical protein SLS55_010423 [Diplodia seriata]|uniref:Uncharacterized protein n=1 Tax=Diplodia seriata TaxID=420778 RepID=A0ABR3BZ52_9PEZI